MWALRGVRPRSDVGPLDSDNDGDNIVGRYGHRAAAQRGPGARLQAFRAEHPDIETARPAGSHTGMWSAYQGGKILAVKFGLRALLDRLDELLPD